jgi:hypothetical protein
MLWVAPPPRVVARCAPSALSKSSYIVLALGQTALRSGHGGGMFPEGHGGGLFPGHPR